MPIWPSCEAMLMMVPPPALRISGTAYLHIRNAPVRLTASGIVPVIERQSVSTVPSGVTLAATLTKCGELAEGLNCVFD